MRWSVIISDPLNAGVLETIENGVLAGEAVIRAFDPPVITPPGTGKLLNLYVKQNALAVPPRAIVQLLFDETPVFWGPAVTTPHPASPGAGPADTDRDALERLTVVGGEQLLADSIVGARLFEEETDVATIAYELCSLYAHPALSVDQVNFPDTGAVLSIYYKPESTLLDALKQLTETIPDGASVWVDAGGVVRFEVTEDGS